MVRDAIMSSCIKCRKKLQYMPELAGKGKPSHYWCPNCTHELIIVIKKRKISPR